MGAIKFYLRKPNSKNETLIFVSFSYYAHRLRYSTNHSVLPSNWNQREQKVSIQTDPIESEKINTHLSIIASAIQDQYNTFIQHGFIPSTKELKNVLDVCLHAKLSNTSEFWTLFNAFITDKKTQNVSVSDYDLALRKHLRNLELYSNKPITLEFLKARQNGFFQSFEFYLTFEALNRKGEKGLAINTIGKQVKGMKVFLHWCFDNNYLQQFSLKPFVTRTEDIQSVYLTETDLTKLKNVQLNEVQSIVRDLFIIGCETGLRFSDFSQIQASQIQEDLLHVYPKKTSKLGKNNLILIPISSAFRELITKYKGKIPNYSLHYLSQFNSELRNICKQAGIADTIYTRQVIAEKVTILEQQKWELISSHTCRRTFCTLKFLEGMPAMAIMKFSGHKTERNFMRYLRLDAQLNAEHYKAFFH